MAPKVVITEQAKSEEDRLGIDLEEMVHSVLSFAPAPDLMGMSKIIFAYQPINEKRRDGMPMGSYFRKHGTQDAYIEIYMANLTGTAKTPKGFNLGLPILLRGLAEVIYHEVGHHVRQTRSHGVENVKNESFAEAYARRLLAAYLRENASAIDDCFKELESGATEIGLSLEIIQGMKLCWEKERDSMLMKGKS